MKQALVIGVTGAIGAGKSTVSRHFAQRGAIVIDADEVGHEVLAQPDVIERLAEVFGPGILGTQGRISRRALGAIVFADAGKRRQLEEVVHPRMTEILREAVERGKSMPRSELGADIIVLDAAILLEAGWDRFCDRILFVDAPRSVREKRLFASRGWTSEELDKRELAQWPLDDKRRRAQVVISNGGDWEDCRRQVDRLFDEWSVP